MRRIFMVIIMVFVFLACGEKTVKIDKTGSDGYDCFPNDTCNTGLVCIDGTCEKEVVDEETDESLDEDIILDEETDESLDESLDEETDEDIILDEEIDESLDEDVEDDTPWVLINGDYWLKEKNLISFVFEGGLVHVDDFGRSVIEKCTEIGGRLPTINDFRKNITDTLFENLDLSFDDDDCPIYHQFGNFNCNTTTCSELLACKVATSENTKSKYFYLNNYHFWTATFGIISTSNSSDVVSIGFYYSYVQIEDRVGLSEFTEITHNSIEMINSQAGQTMYLTCLKN
jgi:hypothetical protein